MKGKRSVMKLAQQALGRQTGSRHKRRVEASILRKVIKDAIKNDKR